jgi:hypothetical protein
MVHASVQIAFIQNFYEPKSRASVLNAVRVNQTVIRFWFPGPAICAGAELQRGAAAHCSLVSFIFGKPSLI